MEFIRYGEDFAHFISNLEYYQSMAKLSLLGHNLYASKTPREIYESEKDQREFYKNRSESFYIEAVKNHPHDLRFIRNQTFNICLAAYNSDEFVLRLVDFRFRQACINARGRRFLKTKKAI